MSWHREIRQMVRRLIRGEMSSIRTSFPAQVDAYDADTRTVSVRPCIRVVRSESPDVVDVDLPILTEVPILTYGSGTLLVGLPVAPGSYGLVVCCDRDIAAWLTSGGVTTPASSRQFDLSDAVFVPGLYPYVVDGDNGRLEAPVVDGQISLRTRAGDTYVAVADDDTISITSPKASIVVDTDGNVTITSDGKVTTSATETVLQDGADWAVQYTALKSAFDTLKTDFNNHVIWTTAHVHPGVLAGPASTAVATPPPVQTAADMSGAKILEVRVP